MPKKSITFDTFHGGFNNVSAQRDILHSQLYECTDASVDKIGQIKTLGGTASQGAISDVTSSTTPGHGLFHWRTDYQRIIPSSVKTITRVDMIANGGETANFVCPGHGFIVDNVVYISKTSKYNGKWKIHSKTTNAFFIKPVNGASKVQYLGSDTGEVSTLSPSSDDSFFALCDYKSSVIDIYSSNSDNWFTSEIYLGGSDVEAVYYAVDGALRICDRRFSDGSANRWYGYINRELFPKSNKPFQIDGFYSTFQRMRTSGGIFNSDQEPNTRLTSVTTSNNDYTFASGGQSAYITLSDLNADAGNGRIGRLIAKVNVIVDSSFSGNSSTSDDYDYQFSLKYGDSDSSTVVNNDVTSGLSTGEGTAISVAYIEHEISIEFPADSGPITNLGGNTYHTVQIVSSDYGQAIENIKINSLEFFKDNHSTTSYHINSGTMQVDFKFGTPSQTASGWDTRWGVGVSTLFGEGATRQESMVRHLKNVDDNSIYISDSTVSEGNSPRITFIFDYSGPYLKQEVLTDTGVAVLTSEPLDVSETGVDVDDGTVFQVNDRILIESEVMKVSSISVNTLTVVRGSKNSEASTHIDNSSIYFVNKSDWDPRATGIKLYMRDVHMQEDKSWKPQIEIDFLRGTSKIIRTGHEEDILYNDDDRYYCYIPRNRLLEPNLVGNYETESGVDVDEKSVHSQYKTATIANGRTYIGNLNVTMIGQSRKVRMGDTIIKSPVNKYDIFPYSNRIDVAINDGEHIIKLENFNDRLLCFKEETLYIINISQDIEFVEGVYNHRGVQYPYQVFKTDFGVAWANRIGVFLYDGQSVINLTEIKGQKIIDWSSEVGATESPMVGYSPRNRQLVVCEDSGSLGNFVWVYDFDVRSWVRGKDDSSYRYFDINKTNFVIDYNDDLIFAKSIDSTASKTHTFLKWTDTPQAGNNFIIKTKDIDFGNIAARKKVHSVQVTYSCSGDSGIRVVLAGTSDSGSTNYPFDATSSTLYGGSTLDDTSGEWKTAILKPSSSINNIYSANIVIDGPAVASFKINDISIVYRIKPVK